MDQADADFDALLDKFIRDPDAPRPEWAFDPNRSLDEQLQEIPFFMTRLPDKIEGNTQLEALQALLYDGTPEENARNFKENGNEAYKAKKYQDAWVFYTKGLDLKCADAVLNAQLLSNRAAVSLAVRNYGFALRDAAKAITLDPELIKAYWRAAKAALELKKVEEATVFAKRGLEKAPENTDLLSIIEQAARVQAQLEADNAKREAHLAQGKQLVEAFSRRGVVHQADAEKHALSELPPGIFGSTPPKARFGKGKLTLPIVFMYPTLGQFDLIEAADESTCLMDHLSEMFASPAPWDPERLYSTAGRFVAFIRAINEEGESPNILYRVNLRTPLNRLLGSVIKAFELGILTIYVLPNQVSAKEFERKFPNFEHRTI